MKAQTTLLILLIIGIQASTQVECYTESDTYSTAISVDCSDRENYSPEIADYIPIKKIRVALHIFQKEDEENKENFDADDLDVIYEIFDYVNAVYANLDPVSPGTSIYIPDSRVQFVLDESNIFFWQDDDDWDWSCGFCHDKAEDIYDE